MAYRDEVLADSPVGYWRLGETSGTVAEDETSNNFDGTYAAGYTLNQTSLLPSDVNPSVSFTRASSGRVSLGDRPEFTPGTTFTVEAWIKLSSYSAGQFHMIAGKGATSNYEWYLAVSDTQTLELTLYDNLTTNVIYRALGATTLSTGTIYHVVGTYQQGVGAYVYVNGSEDGSDVTGSGSVTNGTAGAFIGTRNTSESNYFSGQIDEVAIYSTKLSGARISAHYSAGITISIAVTGQALTSALGTISLTGVDENIPVTGQTLASALGSISLTGVDENVPVTGQSLTSALGTVLIPQDATASVTGLGVAASLGSFTFGAAVKTKVYVSHTEAFSVTDALVRSSIVPLSFSDTLQLTDSTTRAYVAVGAIQEALSLADVSLPQAAFNVAIVDDLAFLSPVDAGADEAWVINLNTNAVSAYNGYGFNSFCVSRGVVYGTSGSKVYSLGDSNEIVGSITTGKTDKTEGMFSRLPYVYVGVSSAAGWVSVKPVLGDDEEFLYESQITNHYPDPLRIKLGHGLRSRHWEFEVFVRSEDPVDLTYLRAPFEATKRRIG